MRSLFSAALFIVLAIAIGCGDKTETGREDAKNYEGKENTNSSTNKTPVTDNLKDTAKGDDKNDSGEDDAEAELKPLGNSKVEGEIEFEMTKDGMKITGEITGLTPGKHGFHIHEFGDCSSPDGKSAGEHFNPTKMDHADHTSGKRHVGDMGNITADKDGKAKIDLLDKMMSFEGPNSILGKSVIVHEKEDDLKTQPSGNSGNRLACGVIKRD